MDNSLIAILLVIAIFIIWLCFQRWFWILTFGITALAAAFSCIASIIHFSILPAIGFLFLAAILGSIATAIVATAIVEEG